MTDLPNEGSAAEAKDAARDAGQWLKRRGCVFWGLAIFVGLVALGQCAPETPDGPSPEAEAAANEAVAAAGAVPDVPADRTVTSQKLAGAFAANEVAAKSWADGGPVKVTGPIEAIELDLFDNPTVSMTGYEYNRVTAHFDKSASEQVSALRQGQKVTVICAKVGEVMGSPQLNDCVLAPKGG